jgi:hypothetical protein
MADPQPPVASAAPDTKNAVISLVCGILSLVVPFIGLILAIVAIVYYFKQKKIAPNGMATAGLVCGIIGLLVSLLLLMFMLIGAFAYIGVLSPDNFLPDKCTMTPPFSCTEYFTTPDGAIIRIRNGAGVDMSSVKVTAACNGLTTDLGLLANGATGEIRLACPAEAGRLTTMIDVEYLLAGIDAPRTAAGSLQVAVR